jgi:hypothetical protein
MAPLRVLTWRWEREVLVNGKRSFVPQRSGRSSGPSLFVETDEHYRRMATCSGWVEPLENQSVHIITRLGVAGSLCSRHIVDAGCALKYYRLRRNHVVGSAFSSLRRPVKVIPFDRLRRMLKAGAGRLNACDAVARFHFWYWPSSCLRSSRHTQRTRKTHHR